MIQDTKDFSWNTDQVLLESSSPDYLSDHISFVHSAIEGRAIIAWARIDNKRELYDKLRIPVSEVSTITIAELILRSGTALF